MGLRDRQFGNQPASLEPVIPQEELLDTDGVQIPFARGQAPGQEPEVEQTDEEVAASFLASLEGEEIVGEESVGSGFPELDAMIASNTEVADGQEVLPDIEEGMGFLDQAKHTLRRAKFAFLADRDDESKMSFFKGIGYEAQRSSKDTDEWLVRKKGSKGAFARFDSESIEWIDDFIADGANILMQTFVSGGIEATATVAGGLGGLAVGGGATAGVGAVPSALAGAAAGERIGAFVGGAVGQGLADFIADGIVDTDANPELAKASYDKWRDAMVAGSFDLVGGELMKGLAKWGRNLFVPEKGTEMLFKKETINKENFDAAKTLIHNNIRLSGSTVYGINNKKVVDALTGASSNPKVIDFQLAQQEEMFSVLKKLQGTVGRKIPKAGKLREAIEVRLKGTNEQLGDAIGEIKELVGTQAIDTHIAPVNVVERSNRVLSDLGVKPENMQDGFVFNVKGAMRDIFGAHGVGTKNAAPADIKRIRQMFKELHRLKFQSMVETGSGNAGKNVYNFDTLLRQLDQFGQKAHYEPGKKDFIHDAYRQLRQGLTKDRDEFANLLISKNDGTELGAQLKEALGSFHGRIDTIREMSDLIENDTRAFARMFTGGEADGVQLLAINKALQGEPRILNPLKAQIFDDMLQRVAAKNPNGTMQFNLGKMQKNIKENFGQDVWNKMFSGQAKEFDTLAQAYDVVEKNIMRPGAVQSSVMQKAISVVMKRMGWVALTGGVGGSIVSSVATGGIIFGTGTIATMYWMFRKGSHMKNMLDNGTLRKIIENSKLSSAAKDTQIKTLDGLTDLFNRVPPSKLGINNTIVDEVMERALFRTGAQEGTAAIRTGTGATEAINEATGANELSPEEFQRQLQELNLDEEEFAEDDDPFGDNEDF